MAYIQLVTIHAKPGSASKIVDHLKKIRVESLNDEPGTKIYETAQDPNDENLIVIWEEYDSEAARDEHRKGKAYGCTSLIQGS
ncbi:hypothetical protein BCR39DRAFT_526956 [Naematelia encephala]|uniref:ABM domain-containing protein n=1 Tax=Naematelia encephala TaxID=71784 RepID=A0A1Y2BAV7_9TREE|nr:hypothetical protein BCR39DRAFT_526956 [Naematelia encephala]